MVESERKPQSKQRKRLSQEEKTHATPTILLSPRRWAKTTFGSAHLGDPRRTRRAVTIATALATETGASLPKQLHDPAALEATYRFLHSGHVSSEALLQPHIEATVQDCRQQETVLLIQDTTEVDYQHHPQTTGLRPIGNGTCKRQEKTGSSSN